MPEDAALMAEGSTQPFAWSASAVRPDRNDARTTGTAPTRARTRAPLALSGPGRVQTPEPVRTDPIELVRYEPVSDGQSDSEHDIAFRVKVDGTERTLMDTLGAPPPQA